VNKKEGSAGSAIDVGKIGKLK